MAEGIGVMVAFGRDPDGDDGCCDHDRFAIWERQEHSDKDRRETKEIPFSFQLNDPLSFILSPFFEGERGG